MASSLLDTSSALIQNTLAQAQRESEFSRAQDLEREKQAQGLLENTMGDISAMDRLKQTQEGQALLETSQQRAQLARDQELYAQQNKQREQEIRARQEEALKKDFVFMSPQIVKGLKETMDIDLGNMQDDYMPTSILLATIAANSKIGVAGINADAKVKTGSRKSGSGGMSESQLRQLENSVASGQNAILSQMRQFKGKLPEEAFGGEDPVNSFMAYISSGKLGKLSKEEQTQINLIKDQIAVREKQKQRLNSYYKSQNAGQIGSGASTPPSGGGVDKVGQKFGF